MCYSHSWVGLRLEEMILLGYYRKLKHRFAHVTGNKTEMEFISSGSCMALLHAVCDLNDFEVSICFSHQLFFVQPGATNDTKNVDTSPFTGVLGQEAHWSAVTFVHGLSLHIAVWC